LESIRGSAEREAYILMEMIKPPITTNYMVRPGQEVMKIKCVSELGIFGAVIG
jgi:glutathione synthase